MAMIAAGDQRRTGGHAEDAAGRVRLGHDEHGTNEQERKAERGHFQVLGNDDTRVS